MVELRGDKGTKNLREGEREELQKELGGDISAIAKRERAGLPSHLVTSIEPANLQVGQEGVTSEQPFSPAIAQQPEVLKAKPVLQTRLERMMNAIRKDGELETDQLGRDVDALLDATANFGDKDKDVEAR